MRKPLLALPFSALLIGAYFSAPSEKELIVIATKMWHLGNDEEPAWEEASAVPEGGSIEVSFEARSFPGEGILFLRQRHVDDAWHLSINGQRIATLDRGAELTEHRYRIPPGVMRDGENRLTLIGDQPNDDITVGDFRYYPGTLREFYDLLPVRVTVSDGERPLPARLTVVDSSGELAELYYAERLSTAVRTGVVYTMNGEATFELPPGEYTVFAARGMEWSFDQAAFAIGPHGQTPDLALALKREVDTTGFVAADTHIHTLTHSGHGDSSMEERQVTLAGEGVELAIATDHNHNTDYGPLQREMGLAEYYTPVVGNEVSTPIGHLNAFPLDPDEAVPPHDLRDIEAIVRGIRERGARAVILNHPRWPNHESGPHGVMELDPLTGEWSGSWATPYDAIELVNSQTEEHEPMLLFRDWFALLNRGARVMGVGSSDSHTVGGVVGQGRTYVKSETDDPSAIDVLASAANIASGRASVSMGIFADLRSSEGSVLGERLSRSAVSGLHVRVASPSWVRPEKLTVFANGTPILERELTPQRGQPFDVNIPLDGEHAWPQHDFWLTTLVTGAGIGQAWWPQVNDYTLAATNPVWVDVDGDGAYLSPRGLALRLFRNTGSEREDVAAVLERVDTAVAAQLLVLVREDLHARAEREAHAVGTGALDRHPRLKDWLDGLEAEAEEGD